VVKHGVAPDRACSTTNLFGSNILGISAFYGELNLGDPVYDHAPAVNIIEMPTANNYVRSTGLTAFPAGGRAIISGDADNTITLKAGSFYVTITASSKKLALDAAHALLAH